MKRIFDKCFEINLKKENVTSKDDENLYIKVLKFGSEHPEGFTFLDLIDSLKLNASEIMVVERLRNDALNSGEIGSVARSHGSIPFIYPDFKTPFFVSKRNDANPQASIFILKYDAYLDYLRYRSLRQAERSSEHAEWLARWSLGISIALAIASICVQIFGSVSLDNLQLSSILQSIQKVNPMVCGYHW